MTIAASSDEYLTYRDLSGDAIDLTANAPSPPLETKRYLVDDDDDPYLNIEAPPAWSKPDWFMSACSRLQQLSRLEPGWDSYDGQPPKLVALGRAAELLWDVLPKHASLPNIVPLPSGNLQLEWHENGVDVEIEVSDAGPREVYIHDVASGAETEVPADQDLSRLADLLRKHFYS